MLEKYRKNYYKSKLEVLTKKCQCCNKDFETTNNIKKYCSNKCREENNRKTRKDPRSKDRKKNCKYCQSEFIDESKFNKKTYCSEECHKMWMLENPRHTKICPECNVEFKTNWKEQKHCSDKCSFKFLSKHNSKDGIGNNVICISCGKEYKKSAHHAGKFCSRKCFVKFTGIKEVEEYKYKSNLTDASSIRRAKRYGVKYENIDPLEIFNRDNWICGICGEKIDKKLNYPDNMSATLDHIIPLSKGGTHTKDNVQACHGICNYRKGNR